MPTINNLQCTSTIHPLCSTLALSNVVSFLSSHGPILAFQQSVVLFYHYAYRPQNLHQLLCAFWGLRSRHTDCCRTAVQGFRSHSTARALRHPKSSRFLASLDWAVWSGPAQLDIVKRAWNVLPRSEWEEVLFESRSAKCPRPITDLTYSYAARKGCKVNQTQWPENRESPSSSHPASLSRLANESCFAKIF